MVATGQRIEAGQVIADGAATQDRELALGRNVLVTFMPLFTSIHIETFEVEARETKMGKEEITREIPINSDEEDDKSEPKLVPEEFVHQLDDEGIICIGTKVKPGMILVGKVTPKGVCDLGQEESYCALFLGRRSVSSRSLHLCQTRSKGKGNRC